MKKKLNLFALCTLGLSLSLTSCFEDNGEHYTEILYPKGGVKSLYADQTLDSLVFVTFDSWTMDTVYGNLPNDDKLAVAFNPEDKAGIVQKDHYMRKCIPFTFMTNATDTIRQVMFNVKSYGTVFSATYKQMHFHNFERPKRREFKLELTDSATCKADSLIFTTYADWNLKVKDAENTPWLRLGTESGKKGKHIVRLNMDENTEKNSRRATIILTGINETKTEVTVVQTAAKK